MAGAVQILPCLVLLVEYPRETCLRWALLLVEPTAHFL